MAEPKSVTIDRLPLDVSVRYAKDQKILEKPPASALTLPDKIAVSTLAPVVASGIAENWMTKPRGWAGFTAPKGSIARLFRQGRVFPRIDLEKLPDHLPDSLIKLCDCMETLDTLSEKVDNELYRFSRG